MFYKRGSDASRSEQTRQILPPQRSLSQCRQEKSEGSATCTFCKQGDPSASCGVDTDIEASFNRLRNLLKLEDHFFICLHCNNLAKNCSQVKACRICSGRHHISICEKANSSRVISENADQGGKRSYIPERAKEKLGLFPKREEKLLIKTFGQENEDLKSVKECRILCQRIESKFRCSDDCSYRPSYLISYQEKWLNGDNNRLCYNDPL
ncbi:hypothetical protein pdam_00013437 [Pocillopora damicornis]|uniref:Uncharacterized protein n=1 Tax=Pocillopora damicornis TaxID=46731 RepID=A0A3M6UXK8_POCDA|nr:hypothetical protein pdam_00013437 [Pocillopora damicornis]